MAKEIEDKTTVCILGGTGFLGRHLIKVMENEPGVHIKALSRNKNKLESFSKKIQVVEGDLLDRASLANFLEPQATVINLAYLNFTTKEDNLKAVENFAYWCEQAGVSKLIHCSTAVIVGNVKDSLVTEETRPAPVTEYERVKLEIESLLIRKLRNKCVVIIARPTAVFGEGGKNLLKLTNDLFASAWLIKVLKTTLYSKRRLNLVYVETVVEAIWFLARLHGLKSGECFIISDDEDPMNNYYDVARILSIHFGIRSAKLINLPFLHWALSLVLKIAGRSNTNLMRTYSCEKLLAEGFKKTVSFKSGLERFAVWYKSKHLK